MSDVLESRPNSGACLIFSFSIIRFYAASEQNPDGESDEKSAAGTDVLISGLVTGALYNECCDDFYIEKTTSTRLP